MGWRPAAWAYREGCLIIRTRIKSPWGLSQLTLWTKACCALQPRSWRRAANGTFRKEYTRKSPFDGIAYVAKFQYYPERQEVCMDTAAQLARKIMRQKGGKLFLERNRMPFREKVLRDFYLKVPRDPPGPETKPLLFHLAIPRSVPPLHPQ